MLLPPTFGQHISHLIKERRGPDDPEFLEGLQEAFDQARPEDLIAVADALAERHARFRTLLDPERPWELSKADLRWIADAVTPARRLSRRLQEALAHRSDVVPLFRHLLQREGEAANRLAHFIAALDPLDPRLSLELATGLLHYTFPQEHWLWTRWLWDPSTHTGILPLLAGSVQNLLAEDWAGGYRRVGAVTAMCLRFGEGTGLLVPQLVEDPRRRPFAADAFLACAYAVYLFGVTSWRLSREFHRLLPGLPGLMRRLLGFRKERSVPDENRSG